MKLQNISQIIQLDIITVNKELFNERIQAKFNTIWSEVDFFSMFYLSDGRKIKGFIVEPKEGTNLPVIIYNRGGSKEYGMIEETQLFLRLAEIASWGYVVFASQYSGNDGSEGKDECGGMDVNDIVSFKPIIDQYHRTDSDNIGMFGGSRGGMMSFLTLKKVDWIKAIVIKSGSTNECRGYRERPDLKEFRSDMYDVDSENENIKRSSIYWIDKLPKDTPILLFHGTNDESVSPLDALEMGVQLFKNKIPFEMHIYNNDDHKLSKNNVEIMEKTHKWFDNYLKNNENTSEYK
jgi:dipeptidyl aminopeptidase/acylaminoacyl peptidase